jgi:hypothetical protein
MRPTLFFGIVCSCSDRDVLLYAFLGGGVASRQPEASETVVVLVPAEEISAATPRTMRDGSM